MVLFKHTEHSFLASGRENNQPVVFGKAKAFLKTYEQERAEREAAMRAQEIEDARREAEFWAGRGAHTQPIRL